MSMAGQGEPGGREGAGAAAMAMVGLLTIRAGAWPRQRDAIRGRGVTGSLISMHSRARSARRALRDECSGQSVLMARMAI
jgi:hypothetical protein